MKNSILNRSISDLRKAAVLLLTGSVMLMTMAGCAKENNISGDESVVPDSTVISPTEADNGSDTDATTTGTTLSLDSYKFPWEDDENYDFDNFVTEKYGVALALYLSWFGFTEELNTDFTNFVNDRFKTDYEMVPFKKANYFFTYIKISEVRDFYDDYQIFEISFLNKENFYKGSFNNKLIMSYLAQNNIPFGYRIPIENMKALIGDNVYTCDLQNLDRGFGNYEDSYVFSSEDLVKAIEKYNLSITALSIDKGIKELDLKDHIDVCDTWNEHLVTFFWN